MDIGEISRAVPADPRTRRSWVIYHLKLRGTTLAQLAQTHGVTRQCLYHVFARPYPHMEELVAHAIGIRPEVLFAERYDTNGKPARRMGRPKKVSCHGKNHKPNTGGKGKPWRTQR